MMGSAEEFQARITRLLLDAVEESGFALAGAGAIRAHGLTDRPTQDVDLFAGPLTGEDDFRAALDAGDRALGQAGFEVTRLRESGTFARLRIHDPVGGRVLDVDFAVNWRADAPVEMSVGPVLSERDAVAGKLSAVYSRGEVRDFLDLDAIRASGRYTDADLLALGKEHDDGFDRSMFAAQLSRIANIDPVEAEEYGITSDAFEPVRVRTMRWALELRDASFPGTTPRRATTPKRPASTTRRRGLSPSVSTDPHRRRSRDDGRTGPDRPSL